MKLLILVLLLMAAAAVAAEPFLWSSYYPTTGTQPDTCSFQEGTTKAVTAPVDKDPGTGQVRCKIDVVTLANGAHTLTVWASNVWGDSSKVPFTFARGTPGAPTGIYLAP